MPGTRADALLAMLVVGLVMACGGETPATQSGTAAVPTPRASPSREPTASATSSPEPTAPATPIPDTARLRFDTLQWRTDFSTHSVPLDEIFPGGPAKDGIPPIDRPLFVTVDAASAWLAGREPVVVVELAGEVHAYPVQILMWHEIVNDVVGGQPVVVTYCPLCNSALVFEATLDGRVETFGTTGNLRFSDLVMYDRTTESWWQQVTGEAIVGERTGQRLTQIPAPMVSWDEFRAAHPAGLVLSQDTGHTRPYGVNPYSGYDTSAAPFLYDGPADGRLAPIERVATVELGGEAWAFPFEVLRTRPVVHQDVGGRDVVVFFKPGTASALDRRELADGRDVGSTGIFIAESGGRMLRFEQSPGGFKDTATGSTWNLFGEAVDGPLKGATLEPVPHGNHFWFAWAVFKPGTNVYRP
jgi:hypothetical protein